MAGDSVNVSELLVKILQRLTDLRCFYAVLDKVQVGPLTNQAVCQDTSKSD
jgi:hypothetical protein